MMHKQHTGVINVNQFQLEGSKKHNTAATSREAFADYCESGKRETEKLQALTAIAENQPVTSRQLGELMHVERCHITRCLKDLEEAGKIRLSHTAKCPVTGKRVKHYCLIDWSPSLFPNQ